MDNLKSGELESKFESREVCGLRFWLVPYTEERLRARTDRPISTGLRGLARCASSAGGTAACITR